MREVKQVICGLGCILALCVCLVSDICLAQAPPTIRQALSKKGIGSSNQELYRALRSADSNVRSLAAGQLAENGDRGAIPLLADALENESDVLVRFNIARSLTSLGDTTGIATFQSICSDGTVSADFRIEAARDEARAGESKCFPSIVAMLSASNDSVETQAALGYFRNTVKETLSSEEASQLFAGLKKALQNEIPEVREWAAACISKYRVAALLPYVRTAARKESQPDVKAAMKSAEDVLSR